MDIATDNISKIAKFLTENNYTLSIAESCTGGLISSLFTDIPGASKYIKQNFVTYANASKINLLGVNPDTIGDFGVISKQVASEMAHGLILNYNVDFALSTTGILGPNPIEFKGEKIEAGTVFICAASKSDKFNAKTVKYISCKKTRTDIKKDIADYAVGILWGIINEGEFE